MRNIHCRHLESQEKDPSGQQQWREKHGKKNGKKAGDQGQVSGNLFFSLSLMIYYRKSNASQAQTLTLVMDNM